MLKEKKYNEELRSRVLICSIRAEDSASEILISLLRRVRPDSKTLGNKSSSLSFKNKIDLLYDIGDLSKEEYASMLKFMEIRNQFIHNGSCNSFLDLAAQYPDIKTYLKKFHPNDVEDEEDSLEKSFGELFITVLGKLLILKIEYRKGATAEMDRFIDAQAFKNIGNAYQSALKTFNASVYNSKPVYQPFGLPANTDKNLEVFESYLKHAIIDEQIKVCDAIASGQFSEKDVYERKKELKDIVAKEKI